MGEAKRRQQLDPNYGKQPPYEPKITITESPITQNFLVMVDNECLDSTIHWEEAENIKRWLEQELCERPLKRGENLLSWLSRSERNASYPQTTAEVLAFNRATNTLKKAHWTL